MFVLWIGTVLLGSSPELHRLLHSDANSPNHHCVVTQVKEHSVLSGISFVAVPLAPTVTLAAHSPKIFFPSVIADNSLWYGYLHFT